MPRLFGTDGVRGRANSGLTVEMALGLAQAGAVVLGKGRVADGRRASGRRPIAVVARDPRISGEFLSAAVMAGLSEFVLPYIALRNVNRGYAVSIVKAGMTAIGRSAGPVRSPLTDLTASELEALKALIAKAQASLAGQKRPVLAKAR